MYKSPTTKEEYWSTIDKYWDDIFHLLNIYLPTFRKIWIDGGPIDITLGEYLVVLKNNRNPRLVRALSAAWWNMSDIMNISDYPANVIYDLCVLEECCLYEERECEDND